MNAEHISFEGFTKNTFCCAQQETHKIRQRGSIMLHREHLANFKKAFQV